MDIAVIISLLGLTGVNTGMLLSIKYEIGGLAKGQGNHEERIKNLEGAFIQQLKEA